MPPTLRRKNSYKTLFTAKEQLVPIFKDSYPTFYRSYAGGEGVRNKIMYGVGEDLEKVI